MISTKTRESGRCETGEVVAVIVSALSGKYFLDNQGTIPQNVNYAIKKGYFEAFMGNYPECVKDVVYGDGRKLEFSDAVETVRRSIALIEVY